MLAPLLSGAVFLWWTTSMPGTSWTGPLPALTPEEAALRDRLRRHVAVLAGEIGPRGVFDPPAMERAVAHVERAMRAAGLAPSRETWTEEGLEVCNVVAETRGTDPAAGVLVVGAHYDSVAGCPAADDNGSGVAALLELPSLLAGRTMRRTVRWVAFANEEPPFFGTERMGSSVHARRAAARGDRIAGMISLETLGYYADGPGSQRYPRGFALLYPAEGNFLCFVGNVASRSMVRSAVATFREHATLPSEGAALPGWIPGVSLSDQRCFWAEGWPALMVTDTAPFRYEMYHSGADTPDQLDYDRFARAVAGLAPVVAHLADAP